MNTKIVGVLKILFCGFVDFLIFGLWKIKRSV